MDNALEKIYKAGLKFLVPLTPEETYRIIVHEAVKLVEGEGGAIFLSRSGKLRRVYQSTPAPTVSRGQRGGFTYTSFREKRPLIVHPETLLKIHPELVEAGVRSTVFIPLSYRNRAIGVLIVRSQKEGRFTDYDQNILKLFGSMASLAIRKTQLYDETKKAVEVRDLFLSMAAHEFRTPLTTISGYAQLLVSKVSKNDGALSRWAEELVWEASRLTSLVNELLEVSRIKGGQFQYIWREHHLSKVIERSASEFHFNYPGRKMIFENKVEFGKDKVVGDFDKLIQVVSNLLDNAAKFSPPGKEIYITLKFRSPNLVIVVKDSGYGIDSKDLPRIFEGFYRSNAFAAKGMGLGLFLAKNIISQHHGFISVRSKLGRGTKVEIKLPSVKI